MKRFNKNIISTFFFQLSLILIGILVSILLARVLGPTGRGIFALILIVPETVIKIGSFGIESATVFLIAEKKYPTRLVVSNSCLLTLFSCLIITIFLFFLLNLETFHKFIANNQIAWLHFLIVASAIPFCIFFRNFVSIFQGLQKITLYNTCIISQNLIYLILLSFFFIFFQTKVTGAVLAYLISWILIFIVALYKSNKIIDLSLKYNSKISKTAIKFGAKTHIANLAQFLNYRLDVFIIAIYLPPESVGYYAVATLISERLWTIPNSIGIVLFPKVSSTSNESANIITAQVSRNTLFLVTCLVIIVATASYPIIYYLFGEKFISAVKPMLFLLPGITTLSVSKIFAADLSGRGRPQYATYASTSSLISNVFLNLILIPRFGISGAAIASSISYTIASIILFFAFINVSKIPWKDTLFLKPSDFSTYKKFIFSNKLWHLREL
jgi:O-antigen/teichoic acid export membrane protein